MNEKVFISWHKDNVKVAKKVAALLEQYRYIPIVGGGSGDTSYVGQKIISQMQDCDLAIMLLEEIKTGDASKISENIMFEWGYLSARLNDPKKIFIFLIDTPQSSLPTDVLGSWVNMVTRSKKDENIDEYQHLANQVTRLFIKELENRQTTVNKLSYLANWNQNKTSIYKYNGVEDISSILLYSVQAPVYYDEMRLVYDKLKTLHIDTDKSQNSIVMLVTELLSVFIVSDRLTRGLTPQEYSSLVNSLGFKYEKDQKNEDMKAWCEIFRKDKLELCHELAVDNLGKPKKYLLKAYEQGEEVIRLIKAQIKKNPLDASFGNLYLALVTRNMAEVCKKMMKYLEDDKKERDKYQRKEKKFREESFDYRDNLRWDYKSEFGTDYIYDCLEQEYMLAKLETFKYVKTKSEREDIIDEIRSQLAQWELQSKRRNMIIDKIKDEGHGIIDTGENDDE